MKLEPSSIVFVLVSACVILTGMYVVLARNVVRAAFALLATLFGVAVLYATLQADFLAAVQVLIYVGGINILIIFGVMLTEHLGKVPMRMVSLNIFLAALVCIALFVVLAYSLVTFGWPAPAEAAGPTTAEIGRQFLSTYLLPFELASVVLLVVLVGAVAVGRKEVREK